MEKIVFILAICLSVALITSAAPAPKESETAAAPPAILEHAGGPADGQPKDLDTANFLGWGLGYGLGVRSAYGYGGYGYGYPGYGYGGYYGGYGYPGSYYSSRLYW